MKLDKQLAIKAVAAFIILAFIAELFIVLTYAPSTPPTEKAETPQVNTTDGSAKLKVKIKNFAPNLIFVCNSTSSNSNASVAIEAAFENLTIITGKPIQIGITQKGQLYTVRSSNASETANAARAVEDALLKTCNYNVVLRQAEVTFNESKGVNFSASLAGHDHTGIESQVFVNKFALDAYRDEYGRQPIALISSFDAEEKDVVEVFAFAKIQGSRLVAGSLTMEQEQAQPEVKNFEANAAIISMQDKFAVVEQVVPWSKKNYDFTAIKALNASVETQINSIAIFSNATLALKREVENSSGVLSVVEKEGELEAKILESFVDEQSLTSIASKHNVQVKLPVSAARIQVSFENLNKVREVLNRDLLELRVEKVLATVQVLNSSELEFQLPSFEVFVFANSSVNDTVRLRVFAVVNGKNVLQVNAMQV